MTLWCGTSGFSFKEWKGRFYPPKLPANRMLSWYAQRLPAVEINNTFYRMPTAAMLEGWAAQVPEAFRFAVKAPRRITHIKRLADCEDEIRHFVKALEALGSRLGIVLFQLPPQARADVDRLGTFLRLLPEAVPPAFEFRHASWRDEAVLRVLADHEAAWVVTDDSGRESPELPRTAAAAYLRLRAPGYDDEVLRAWKDRCAAFEHAYVFFKHEDTAVGPALALRMLAL